MGRSCLLLLFSDRGERGVGKEWGGGDAWRRDCLVGYKRVRRAHTPGISPAPFISSASRHETRPIVSPARRLRLPSSFTVASQRVDVAEPDATPDY